MNHYFRPSLSMPNIYLYRDPMDFRKSYRGLAAIAEQELDHNPFGSGLYAFINRCRDKFKLLVWEDNGFILYLQAEERFRWPGSEELVIPLSGEQIKWLRSGYDISLMQGHKNCSTNRFF